MFDELRASCHAERRRPIFWRQNRSLETQNGPYFSLFANWYGFWIVTPFSWIFNAISSEKSCPISMPFLTCLPDVRAFFLACWTLIGQLKFPARQPYARYRWISGSFLNLSSPCCFKQRICYVRFLYRQYKKLVHAYWNEKFKLDYLPCNPIYTVRNSRWSLSLINGLLRTREPVQVTGDFTCITIQLYSEVYWLYCTRHKQRKWINIVNQFSLFVSSKPHCQAEF